MKRVWLTLLLTAITVSGAEDKYIRRDPAEKLKTKDLTFAVTFDRHSVNADLAKGNGECLTGKNTNLALRGTMGFDRADYYSLSCLFHFVQSVQSSDSGLVVW